MMADQVELLFFDTFAHDNSEEINLDLVQFPKPVYVKEVRIIPLGARVQADFPGGVRLGATNPSQFQIDFFVNDLAKPGASTFETLGGFEYDQNGCINLECSPDETSRKIPTDGLVLKGWYTTITLAVYGTLTNNLAEQIIQATVPPAAPNSTNVITDVPQICPTPTIEPEWPQENLPAVPVEYNAQQAATYQPYNQNDQAYAQEFVEYYNDVPKDPRSYHQTPETDWDAKSRTRIVEPERERDLNIDVTYQKTSTTDREHGRDEMDRRDREKRFSRSEDRDRQSREFRDSERDRDHELEWSEDYRSDHGNHDWNDRDRDRTRDRDRDRCYKHDDSYKRSYTRGEDRDRDREERKRPRTPPMRSPKRPHSPQPLEVDRINSDKDNLIKEDLSEEPIPESPSKEIKESHTPPAEETVQMDVEEFEPILSDEDILDDMEHYQEDYDYTAYTNNDDIIKLFTPGTSDLLKYTKGRNFSIKNNTIEIDDALKVCIGIADDYFKSSITRYDLQTFSKLNTEIKEEFVHLSEKLITTVGPASVFCDIAKLHVAVKSMNPQGLNANDKELAQQLDCIMETVTDWLKIALNYDMANIQDQPAYKIRHIKCGVKLADWCASSLDYVRFLWNRKFNMHKELLYLFDQEFMALSIKLMILRALDTYLLHKFAIEKFLNDLPRENGYHNTMPTMEKNGYKLLIEHLRRNPLVRVKFALISILRKLNLYETLHGLHNILLKLRNSSNDISKEDIDLITKALKEILNYCKSGPFILSQPKRFLPVTSQFEILRSGSYDILVQSFKMFNLIQCFILLLTFPSILNLPVIKTPIYELIGNLLQNYEGVIYLSDNIETVNVLMKCLLRTDEELQYNMQECLDFKSHHLGLKLAYKLQALYHIEYLLANGKKMDCDAPEIIDHLHALLCLTFNHIGKVSTAEVLGMNNHINSLLQFLEVIFFREKPESKTKKSIGIAYVVDLLCIAVSVVPNIQLMEKNNKILLHLVNQHDLFEDSLEIKMNEIRSYLLPFESGNLHYDNIAPYLSIIGKSYENFIFEMGSIITSLRIIRHLGISPHGMGLLSDNPFNNYIELKYKHVILQLFSLDGTMILTKLLQKIIEYYDQPSTHTSAFVTSHGWMLLNIIQPCIALLKQMLSYVMQCRNTEYKDITTIPVFLEIYNLVNSFPQSAPGYYLAQDIKVDIIDTLLVYTQPISEEVNEKDSLNKTLWTQMCGEMIKFVTSSPHKFISGLLIFSELLPLPLPVQAVDELTKEELAWIVNLRKLWSAHLHPHSAIIQEMINKMSISTQPQLLNLLRRICVQLSDLAANSATMISRGILDNLCCLLVPKEENKVVPCDSHIAKLLNFFACLVTHNTIKCAVLHLIHTNSTVTLKTDEKYSSLIPTFAQILKTNSTLNSHIHSQECILSIIQSFCDIEITVMQNPTNSSRSLTSEEYLANAMPIREHLLAFLHMMWEHLGNGENTFVTYLPIIRTFLLLTEHDYGFFHLRELLLKKNEVIFNLLSKLSSSFLQTNAEYLSTLNTLVEFLRVCVTWDEVNEPNLLYTPRKTKLSLDELKILIGWPTDSKPDSHPLITLEEMLKDAVKDNNTFESFLDGVSALLKLLDEESQLEKNNKEAFSEVILPAPENLLVQFACRTIYSSVDACDERLTTRYWLLTPSDEAENEVETVSCDLLELCRQNIRPEFNIIKEVERLSRISCTENLDDKEKHSIDVKTNMKKPFVTPMRSRGFARSAPQRSDLFRSRPPNTSRPPSLHVDDFVALETCGAQPTGPTGYNKISREMASRIVRGSRGRAFVTSERSVQHRQTTWWGTGMGRGPYHM